MGNGAGPSRPVGKQALMNEKQSISSSAVLHDHVKRNSLGRAYGSMIEQHERQHEHFSVRSMREQKSMKNPKCARFGLCIWLPGHLFPFSPQGILILIRVSDCAFSAF